MCKKYIVAASVFWSFLMLPAAFSAEPDLSREALKNPFPDQPVFSQLPISTYMGGSDPLEGFNRTVFYIGDGFFYYLYRPIGYVYGSIMPRYGIGLINNATNNLEFPRRFLSSALQAEFTWAGTEFLRFLTNSTIGIVGLFDPATHWFGLQEHDEDFGQAFAAWGIGSGCVLQLAGSSNVRDGVGMIFDYAVDIKSYFYGGQAFTMLNRGLDPFDSYDIVRKSTFDSYQAIKDFNLLTRYLKVNNINVQPIEVKLDKNDRIIGFVPRKPEPGEKVVHLADFNTQSAEIDTLRVGWFKSSRDSVWSRLSFWNHDFHNLAQEGSVELGKDRAIGYRYWKNENPQAPLVIILPGVGGHNTAEMAVALAETVVKNNYSALIVSNTMTWEFAEAFDAPVGYAPQDAANLELVLEKVLSDLASNEPEMQPARRMLVGYSQGALNALYLMDRQQNKSNKLNIDRALAINPPVDLLYALTQLDDYRRAVDAHSSAEVIPMLARGVASYLFAARMPAAVRKEGAATVDKEDKAIPPLKVIDQVPVNQQVAEILIAYSFKRNFDDLLVAMHHKAPVNGIVTSYSWGNRQELYDELALWDFKRYCQYVLLPYYKDKLNVKTVEELNASAGLKALEPLLGSNKHIMVMHNADDFLLNAADRKFLRETMQERCLFFSNGGHLGNLYREDVQKEIIKYLNRQLP